MISRYHSRLRSHSSERRRPALALIVLAVAGFWPVLKAHPLMDDHLFFSWLERTSWRDALWQRFTGNWIPEFTQLQMYRPVSGLWQATTYHFFRANALPHHVLNLLLHGGTCFLAGVLARKLTGKGEVGWLVSGLMLVHPRAASGVSLIFNFTDVLSAFLMMLSLVVLQAIRQAEDDLHGVPPCARGDHRGVFDSLVPTGGEGARRAGEEPIVLQSRLLSIPFLTRGLVLTAILWASSGLALGVKEVCLPVLAVLLAAEMMWPSQGRDMGKTLARQAGLLALGGIYLFARTHFVGHPFQTHRPGLSFPLPDHSLEWTIFWDGLLMVFTFGGALLIRRWDRLRKQLPASSDWMLLWSGCMLLPAVHFCSQVTLRPWFFDERYWYVPLVPLSLFAAALLTHRTVLSCAFGAALLAITLPGASGFFIAGMAFLVTISFTSEPPELEIQRTIAMLFLGAIVLVLWQRCAQIKTRADEAAGLQAQLNKVISETPPHSPIALLEFTERTAEPALSLNGLLQWLLTPPFVSVNVSDRFFFAYPTWDSPPTNRYWDRTTRHLSDKLAAGQEVSLYSWNSESRKFRSLGGEKGIARGLSVPPRFQTVPMETLDGLDSKSTPGEFKSFWHSTAPAFDPKLYGALAIRFTVAGSQSSSTPLEIEVSWVTQRATQWSAVKEIRTHLPASLATMRRPSHAELWLNPGRRVDWLLGGGIVELRLMANQPLMLEEVRVGPFVPESVLREYNHTEQYASPGMKFLWETESWWRETE